ncbi:NupC/NupG family nucleoside CNT transporter [Massilibacteroides vaginae]|uniref:NupC/NupG family nucleoside CNT transporter n=1 Tax=Massilibacteroides vaginae TaxID=1673718 RepID=UPI000A1CB17E|nr:nucleoside transporter C-terminal domain-containing protein [Massilibacteroides vaginae]
MINETTTGFSFDTLLRGILGICIIIAAAYLFSKDRKRIDWKLVGTGLILQLLFALAVIYVPFVGAFFELLGKVFIRLMDFTQAGINFLLGPYASKAGGFVFLIHSLPVVIFFSALVSLFYHWGIIQRLVQGLSWLLRRILNISGAEGLVASGNLFLGMTEAPVLIKNYIPSMNRSEVFLIMVTGMATIAGSLMGTYIGLLSGDDPVQRLFFAKHLISATAMAIPGAIVISKMIYPQTEEVVDQFVDTEKNNSKSTALESISAGTSIGVKLMTNIAAMLLVFIALIAMANYILDNLIGHYTGLNDWIVEITNGKSTGLTFQFIIGVVMAPFMWLVGIPTGDMMLVGSLLGQKTILNEFVAFVQFQEWKEAGLFISQKSIIMTTYILCGFANISSIGILIGGIGVLAPDKKGMITRLGPYAMVGGTMVSVLSATLVGMILG